MDNLTLTNIINYSNASLYEDFTDIIVSPNASNFIRDNVDIIAAVLPELKAMEGFDQRSIYHDKDMLEHTLAVLDGIPCVNGIRDVVLAYAALFHDIGKPEKFYIDPEDGHGHMDNHPEASAIIFERFAKKTNMPSDTMAIISKLIINHDVYVDGTQESVKVFVDTMTPELMDKLIILQRADILAHSEIGRKRMAKLQRTIDVWNTIRH